MNEGGGRILTDEDLLDTRRDWSNTFLIAERLDEQTLKAELEYPARQYTQSGGCNDIA
jgi:hypothetical protein